MDKKHIANSLKSAHNELKESDFEILTDDKIKVGCKSCGDCCRNRNDILLRPSDIYSIAKELNIEQHEFVLKYCTVYIGENSLVPIISIKFRDLGNDKSICPFLKKVNENTFHCRIHKSKPSVCRIYPLGRISDNKENTISYLLQNVTCVSEEDKTEMTIKDWVGNDIKLQEDFFLLYFQKLRYIRDNINLKKLWKVSEKRNSKIKNMVTLMQALYLTDNELSLEENYELYKSNEKVDEFISFLKKEGYGINK